MHLQEDAPRVFVLDDTTAPMVPKVVTTVTETVDEEESRRQAEETFKKGGGCFSRWWQPRKFSGKQLILGEKKILPVRYLIWVVVTHILFLIF